MRNATKALNALAFLNKLNRGRRTGSACVSALRKDFPATKNSASNG